MAPHSEDGLVDGRHSEVWLYALEPATGTLIGSHQLMASVESVVFLLLIAPTISYEMMKDFYI